MNKIKILYLYPVGSRFEFRKNYQPPWRGIIPHSHSHQIRLSAVKFQTAVFWTVTLSSLVGSFSASQKTTCTLKMQAAGSSERSATTFPEYQVSFPDDSNRKIFFVFSFWPCGRNRPILSHFEPLSNHYHHNFTHLTPYILVNHLPVQTASLNTVKINNHVIKII